MDTEVKRKRGPRKGTKQLRTLQKEAVAAELKQRVMKHADRLFNAQLSQAVGSIMVFQVIEHKNSKGTVTKVEHRLVTDAEVIKEVLDTGEGLNCSVDGGFYLVTAVPPENRAIDSMLDRTFGKATQSVEVNDVSDHTSAITRAIARMREEGCSEGEITTAISKIWPDAPVKELGAVG